MIMWKPTLINVVKISEQFFFTVSFQTKKQNKKSPLLTDAFP